MEPLQLQQREPRPEEPEEAGSPLHPPHLLYKYKSLFVGLSLLAVGILCLVYSVKFGESSFWAQVVSHISTGLVAAGAIALFADYHYTISRESLNIVSEKGRPLQRDILDAQQRITIRLSPFTTTLDPLSAKIKKYSLESLDAEIKKSLLKKDTTTVYMYCTRAQLRELLALALEGNEVIISEGDKPLTCVIPVANSKRKRAAGLNRGAIWTSEDFDEPLPDEFWTGTE